MIFNTFSKIHLTWDLWLFFDIIAGTVNIGAFELIGSASAEKIYDSDQKRVMDYYILVVLLLSWVRFFSYFLVFDTIGELTITLLRMVQE